LGWEHAAVGHLSFSSHLGGGRCPDEPFLDIALYCLSEQTIRDIMMCCLSSLQQKQVPILRLFMKENIEFALDQFDENYWKRRFHVVKFITWFEAKFA
jgi:hypothetical protein